MENTEQLNQNHHAYGQGHSTVNALLQLCETIFQGYDENKITTVITLVQSSALTN